MDLEMIVLPFHKLILSDHQLLVVPRQQDRLSKTDEDNVMAMMMAMEMALATMMAMLTLIT